LAADWEKTGWVGVRPGSRQGRKVCGEVGWWFWVRLRVRLRRRSLAPRIRLWVLYLHLDVACVEVY